MDDTLEQARWLAETVGVRTLELGAIRVEGEDAREWLNGQITNDVSHSAPGSAVYALVVTVKGRIATDLWVLDHGETLDLLVQRDRLGPLIEHYERYIVMEDVELEGREIDVVSAQGPRSAELEGGFACDRLGSGGRDHPDGDLEEIVGRAAALGGGPVAPEAWELARLRAGRPALNADFDETSYPQEAGLVNLGVSFTKGCYVGQEVVCMLEQRGQLRRMLTQLRGDALPPPGSPLRHEGTEVGTVRSGMLDPADGQAWIHAYIKRAHAEVGTAFEADTGIVTVREILGGKASKGAL